jgi:hypothetical protein
MSMPFNNACAMRAKWDVVSDHSSHGMRNRGTPYKNEACIQVHLRNSHKDVVSSSTSFHQSYRHHTNSKPYTAIVYMRWLGASTRLTGMTGDRDVVGIGVVSGMLGNGDLGLGSFLGSGLL